MGNKKQNGEKEKKSRKTMGRGEGRTASEGFTEWWGYQNELVTSGKVV